jgi:hypothetical protein
MQQQDIIYTKAKENLRNYGRNYMKSDNERVIYEYAAIIYSIRQAFKEDTRNYLITQSIYEIEKEMINKLSNRINAKEKERKEALESCREALDYIEMVVKPRVNLSSLAC